MDLGPAALSRRTGVLVINPRFRAGPGTGRRVVSTNRVGHSRLSTTLAASACQKADGRTTAAIGQYRGRQRELSCYRCSVHAWLQPQAWQWLPWAGTAAPVHPERWLESSRVATRNVFQFRLHNRPKQVFDRLPALGLQRSGHCQVEAGQQPWRLRTEEAWKFASSRSDERLGKRVVATVASGSPSQSSKFNAKRLFRSKRLLELCHWCQFQRPTRTMTCEETNGFRLVRSECSRAQEYWVGGRQS